MSVSVSVFPTQQHAKVQAEREAHFFLNPILSALCHTAAVFRPTKDPTPQTALPFPLTAPVAQVLQTSSKRLNQAAAEAAAVEFTGRHRQRRAEQNGAHPTAMRCSFVSNSRLSSFLVGICRHLDSTLGSVSFCSRSSTLACTAASCSCAQTNETSRVQVPFRQCMEQSSRGRERERDVH